MHVGVSREYFMKRRDSAIEETFEQVMKNQGSVRGQGINSHWIWNHKN